MLSERKCVRRGCARYPTMKLLKGEAHKEGKQASMHTYVRDLLTQGNQATELGDARGLHRAYKKVQQLKRSNGPDVCAVEMELRIRHGVTFTNNCNIGDDFQVIDIIKAWRKLQTTEAMWQGLLELCPSACHAYQQASESVQH